MRCLLLLLLLFLDPSLTVHFLPNIEKVFRLRLDLALAEVVLRLLNYIRHYLADGGGFKESNGYFALLEQLDKLQDSQLIFLFSLESGDQVRLVLEQRLLVDRQRILLLLIKVVYLGAFLLLRLLRLDLISVHVVLARVILFAATKTWIT